MLAHILHCCFLQYWWGDYDWGLWYPRWASAFLVTILLICLLVSTQNVQPVIFLSEHETKSNRDNMKKPGAGEQFPLPRVLILCRFSSFSLTFPVSNSIWIVDNDLSDLDYWSLTGWSHYAGRHGAWACYVSWSVYLKNSNELNRYNYKRPRAHYLTNKEA